MRQYLAARDAIWRGAGRGTPGRLQECLQHFRLPAGRLHGEGRAAAFAGGAGHGGYSQCQADLGRESHFWSGQPTPLQQEIVFASTGTKKPGDKPWKYVEAFAGSDIQTNPPATNEAVRQSGLSFTRQVDKLPPREVVEEIDRLVNMERLEATLMSEGIAKFATPQKSLLALVAEKRLAMTPR